MATRVYKFGEVAARPNFRNSLVSQGGVTGDGGVITGSPTFHPQKGVSFSGTDVLMFSPTDHTALNDGGQLVAYYQADQLADDIDTLWGGADVGANGWLYSYRDALGTVQGRTRRSTSGQFITELGQGDSTAIELIVATGKPEQIRINQTWDGTTMRFYAHGNFLTKRTRVISNADLFEELYIGNNLVTGNGPFLGYVRNFQLSSQPVTLAVHENLTNVAFFGDSFAAGASFDDGVTGSNEPDGSAARGITGYLNLEKGTDITWSAQAAQPESGWGYGGQTISTVATQLDPTDMLASSPQGVIFMGGNNDLNAGTGVPADFETELVTMIDTIMGTASVQWCILCTPTIPFGDATYFTSINVDSALKMGRIMRQVVQDYNDTHAARRGRLSLFDTNAVLGGASGQNKGLFKGEIAGHGTTDANRHPSSKGQEIIADGLAPMVYAAATGEGFEYYSGPRSVAGSGSVSISKVAAWRQ